MKKPGFEMDTRHDIRFRKMDQPMTVIGKIHELLWYA